MKKFICAAPRQDVYPLNYTVKRNAIVVDTETETNVPKFYEPIDCEHLRYEEPCGFPIIPVIHAYTEPGDEIEVLVLTADQLDSDSTDPYSNVGTHINVELLRYDVAAICKKKGIKATVKKIMIPVDERVSVQLDTFERLTKELHEGDAVYADISYGAKTGMYAILLALAYAHKALNNCHVECIVYGEALFKQGAVVKKNLYDETKLFLLDQIMTSMTLQNIENPAALLRSLLHFDTDEEETV